ncbi:MULTISPECIES: DNA recombination protein RmuC [unclassified Moritella]|uniref:DNA recombination protein RmuC n=1 Tax=unclassified Moritella TaxID=2637987 RepID=UPI001BA7D917|nr:MULTISPECIES: DNA recombination protein RmuC [unclassified Moritella]QUM83111.1 DNA recombination protein RmuC [Moritella sp. 28]QUM87404.1 DNA recombination protein RmuC [Moritella sp. 36]
MTFDSLLSIFPYIVVSCIAIIFGLVAIRKTQQANLSMQTLNHEVELLEQQLDNVNYANDQLQKEHDANKLKLESQNNQLIKLMSRLRESDIRLQAERQASEEKLALQAQSEQRLQQQFENLANKIFDSKTDNFKELNKSSVELLLAPLKTQLEGFKQQVQDVYSNEAKERHSLQSEVARLQQVYQLMSSETANLTKALKGDNKQQGNWGEVILARILSESGLREGHEYDVQVSLNNEHGKRFQPDVIVHLPQDKDVVVDSKVSLTAYERYFNADDEVTRKQALQEHVTSIRGHIRELGRKDYHLLQGLKTLDYVLMFVAVEPAFIAALEADPSLMKYALDNNIMLVSPTNLLVALRTIDNLWRYERQNQNAQLIAERAGRIYEKLRLFSHDMQDMGTALDKAQDSYDSAMKRLSSGKGNLIKQAQQFVELGVEVKKPLPVELIEKSSANLLE